MTENLLFICGSLNQTTMMHKISQHLSGYNCYFTPYYADGLVDMAARLGLLNFTVLGGRHLQDTENYLAANKLSVDRRGQAHSYDLVVTCSDLLVQKNIRSKRLVLVQEGITEPEGFVYKLVKWLKLARYLANTSTTGLSDAYDIFCVASQGYRDLFIRKGVRPEKIAVTGIPNFDNLSKNFENDFPFHDFVLAATSPLRETLRWDDRTSFIQKCLRIADGRKLIFKLHPAENAQRARREIKEHAPHALVLTHGNLNHMIANCQTFITQQSTSTFVGLGLGKEVFTNLNIEELRHLMPIQNSDMSSAHIAGICQRVLHTPMSILAQMRSGNRRSPLVME